MIHYAVQYDTLCHECRGLELIGVFSSIEDARACISKMCDDDISITEFDDEEMIFEDRWEVTWNLMHPVPDISRPRSWQYNHPPKPFQLNRYGVITAYIYGSRMHIDYLLRKKVKPWVEANEERINSFCNRDIASSYRIPFIEIPID